MRILSNKKYLLIGIVIIIVVSLFYYLFSQRIIEFSTGRNFNKLWPMVRPTLTPAISAHQLDNSWIRRENYILKLTNDNKLFIKLLRLGHNDHMKYLKKISLHGVESLRWVLNGTNNNNYIKNERGETADKRVQLYADTSRLDVTFAPISNQWTLLAENVIESTDYIDSIYPATEKWPRPRLDTSNKAVHGFEIIPSDMNNTVTSSGMSPSSWPEYTRASAAWGSQVLTALSNNLSRTNDNNPMVVKQINTFEISGKPFESVTSLDLGRRQGRVTHSYGLRMNSRAHTVNSFSLEVTDDWQPSPGYTTYGVPLFDILIGKEVSTANRLLYYNSLGQLLSPRELSNIYLITGPTVRYTGLGLPPRLSDPRDAANASLFKRFLTDVDNFTGSLNAYTLLDLNFIPDYKIGKILRGLHSRTIAGELTRANSNSALSGSQDEDARIGQYPRDPLYTSSEPGGSTAGLPEYEMAQTEDGRLISSTINPNSNLAGNSVGGSASAAYNPNALGVNPNAYAGPVASSAGGSQWDYNAASSAGGSEWDYNANSNLAGNSVGGSASAAYNPNALGVNPNAYAGPVASSSQQQNVDPNERLNEETRLLARTGANVLSGAIFQNPDLLGLPDSILGTGSILRNNMPQGLAASDEEWQRVGKLAGKKFSAYVKGNRDIANQALTKASAATTATNMITNKTVSQERVIQGLVAQIDTLTNSLKKIRENHATLKNRVDSLPPEIFNMNSNKLNNIILLDNKVTEIEKSITNLTNSSRNILNKINNLTPETINDINTKLRDLESIVNNTLQIANKNKEDVVKLNLSTKNIKNYDSDVNSFRQDINLLKQYKQSLEQKEKEEGYWWWPF